MAYQAKDLFQLQTELIDAKVEKEVAHAIDRVIDEIHLFKREVNERFSTIEKRFDNVDHRVTHLEEKFDYRITGMEEKLNHLQTIYDQIRTKVIDYCFKAVVAAIASMVLWTGSHLYLLFH